jgi:hypothetical protein
MNNDESPRSETVIRTTQNGKAFPSDESLRRIAGGDFSVDAFAAALAFLTQDPARAPERMISNYADRARYVISDDWSHYFSDNVPEFDTRWVFDRRQWGLSVLHVKRRSSEVWLMALPDEVQDLDDSLIDANPNALDLEMDDFGVREADELPEWVDDAVHVERETYVEPWPGGDSQG